MRDETFSPLKIGVGIASSGDRSKLEVTLNALASSEIAFGPVVVVEQAEQSCRRSAGQSNLLTIAAPSYENPFAIVLDKLRGCCDLILMMREGVLLAPGFGEELKRLSRSATPIAAWLFRSRLSLKKEEAASVNYPIASATRACVPYRGPSLWYGTPSVFCVSSKHAGDVQFERFARRSDWATYRLFADALERRGLATIEQDSGAFFTVAVDETFWLNAETGRRLRVDLRRFGDAHAAYRGLASAETRRVILGQLRAMLTGSFIAKRASFIAGMLSELRVESRLRRKLHRDIERFA